MRKPSKEGIEVDLTIPINKQEIMSKSKSSCFGKEWDVSTPECSICADRDICGILYKDVVDLKAKDVEKELGSKFLDEANFSELTDHNLRSRIESGSTTVKELIQIGCELSNCDDVVAVKEHLKSWIKSNSDVKTKDGIVWVA